MAEDRLTKKEWEALQAKGGDPVYSEEVQAAIRTGEIKESDLTDEAIQLINQGRLKDAQGVIARNQEKTDLKRDIDFTKNDVYNAGMAANTTNKMATLFRNQQKNKADLAEYRKQPNVPNAIQNQALQQSLSNSQYAQARGLGQDVVGNLNSQNNQSYLNALNVAQQSSNQAGGLQSQNQALFNKKLMANRGAANMQLQYQNVANQNLARNIAGSQAQDAAQNNFNMAGYNAREALRSRDIGRGENRVDSFRNATQETADTIPYLGSKMAGDYTHLNQQRDLDPNRGFMNRHLFAKSRNNPYLQGAGNKRRMNRSINNNQQYGDPTYSGSAFDEYNPYQLS